MIKGGPVTKFSILFIFEVFAKNTISILQVSLIFYLTKTLTLDAKQSYRWLSSFGMIAYASPLFAGYLTDKVIGTSRAMVLGLLIMLVGSVLALHHHLHYALIGIVLIGTGSGFFKPNILTLLDRLFQKHNENRALYFGRFYLASSVGEVIAVIIGGVLAESFLIYNPFYISALSIFTVLALFLYNQKEIFEFPPKKIPINYKYLLGALIFPIILYLSIFYGANEVILVTALAALIWVIKRYNADSENDKKTSLKIFIMIVYGAIFFSLTVQCYFSLNLAIENFVDRKISMNISIPTYWFLLINPLVSLLVGNYISEYFKKFSIVKRMFYGFVTLSLGYFILFVGFFYSKSHINMWVIISSYTILIAASFIIIPQLISELIYSISPKYKSRGVGFWYLTMALAQYLAGHIATFIPVSYTHLTLPTTPYV